MLLSQCFFEETFVSNLKALKEEDKRILLQKIWPGFVSGFPRYNDFSYQDYVDFMGNEIRQIQHHRGLFAAQDLNTTLSIIQTLRDHHNRPCSEIIQILSSQFLNFDVTAIRRSLELSARLWLMLNIRSPEILVGPVFAEEIPVEWEVDTSLDVLVQKCFVKSTRRHSLGKLGSIDSTFSAAYLVDTCGMKLQWTDDISSHLRFNPKWSVLTVYRHKICLLNHLDNKDDCPIPEELLGEVLDTMNLLFPFGVENTRELLMREGQRSIYSLGSCSRSRNLDLGHYTYFGEALKSLIEYFDKQPRTWRQLALDRRNKLEWSAFWVTIMVAVLTVVSIPCSIIQATYSFKAYHVALAQGSDTLKGRM